MSLGATNLVVCLVFSSRHNATLSVKDVEGNHSVASQEFDLTQADSRYKVVRDMASVVGWKQQELEAVGEWIQGISKSRRTAISPMPYIVLGYVTVYRHALSVSVFGEFDVLTKSRGLQYIVLLLSQPSIKVAASQLHVSRGYSAKPTCDFGVPAVQSQETDRLAPTDEEARRAYRIRIAAIVKTILPQLYTARDEAMANRLVSKAIDIDVEIRDAENERDALRTRLEDDFFKSGQEKDLSQLAKSRSARTSTRKAINSAIDEIRLAGMQRTADHLESCICYAKGYWWYEPTSIRWIIQAQR